MKKRLAHGRFGGALSVACVATSACGFSDRVVPICCLSPFVVAIRGQRQPQMSFIVDSAGACQQFVTRSLRHCFPKTLRNPHQKSSHCSNCHIFQNRNAALASAGTVVALWSGTRDEQSNGETRFLKSLATRHQQQCQDFYQAGGA